jgi:hypothetical protein
MRTNESRCRRLHDLNSSLNCRGIGAAPLSLLHLVSARELQDLRAALEEGRVPLDLQAKLAVLAEGDMLHHFIGQNGQLFLSLLRAVEDGVFRGCTAAELERLVRVLAYVRKEDDAIPDSGARGYIDDHQEVRAVTRDLHRALSEFKQWRLRHEVPRLWWSDWKHAARMALA